MKRTPVDAVLLAGILLSGCVSHAPAWENPRGIVVSGNGMAGLTSAAAYQAMLARTARLTVDHGYRYFFITDPSLYAKDSTLKPGASITIRVFHERGTRYPAPGVWDAFMFLAEKKRPTPGKG